jgi:3alpha(or 20beta)-hydroxysteroid dehydrogenase
MSSPMNRLAGKVALITGGSRGMGAASARQFVAEGAKVVVGDILDDDGKALADALGEGARYLHLDVTSEDDWAQAVETTEREFGALNVLVNNAGVLRFGALEEEKLDDFRRLLDINLVGVFLGMRTAIPALRRAGGGSIVNLSSTEGLGASPFLAAYTASKFAVRGITKVAALELGPDNIRVNSVHPGGIDTPMTHDLMGEQGRKYVAKKVALRRMGSAENVAAMITFLASDESAYSTGAEFVVDGGATATAGF